MASTKGVILLILILVGAISLTVFSLAAFDSDSNEKSTEIIGGIIKEGLPLVSADNSTCNPDGGSGGGHCN